MTSGAFYEGTHAAIEAAGGLITINGLAREWGLADEVVRKMSLQPGFPAGVQIVGGGMNRRVFLAAECESWRRRQQGIARRAAALR